LIEGHGIPVNLVVAPANVNDCMLVRETLTGLPVPRPVPSDQKPQNLCLDKGYAYDFVRRLVELLRFVAHIRPIGEEVDKIKRDPAYTPRRWKVERTASWLHRFRRLLIRWDKTADNHLAFLQLAAASITLQQCGLFG
jgi:transposase